LHGFAAPLIAAAMIHSIFDGWMLAVGQVQPSIHAGNAMAAGVLLHKIPESLAYGVILRAALQSCSQALIWAALAQGATVAGALMALASAPYIGSQWVGLLLAAGGGTFLFLGFHAVHGEWKRRAAQRHELATAKMRAD
jgi:zinc transporter ZupT